MTGAEPVLDADQIQAFVEEVFPQAARFCRIEAVGEGGVTVSLETTEEHLRPGGTVSGPTLFTLADTAMYYLVLSVMGRAPLWVTSQLDLTFLRRPRLGTLTATARLLKRGRQLLVGTVHLYDDRPDRPVAHATVTYANAGA